MKNIAYSNKNYPFIYLRYLRYIFYRLIKLLAEKNKSEFKYIYLHGGDPIDDVSKDKLRQFKQLTHFKIVTTNEDIAQDFDFVEKDPFKDSSALILMNDFSLWNCLLNIRALDRVRIIDKNFWSSFEAEIWIKIFNEISSTSQIKEAQQISLENYKKFSQSLVPKESSVCFTSGPSFEQYRKFNYENDFKIVCNSIIKNTEFLDYIGGPDVLVFADPVFHFGLNPYAEEFRKEVIKTMSKYPNCFIFTIQENAHVLNYFFPTLTDRIIGLGILGEYNLISEEKLTVFPTANILTLLMLPIAATFSKIIKVIGADGREQGEKYFWKHSSAAQIDNKMEDAFRYHPSFFRDRIYSEYYEKHCKQLEKHIEFIESKGKLVESLTPSFIPILAKRYLIK
jgi:hypothetical protein